MECKCQTDRNKRSVVEKPKRRKREPIDKIINSDFEKDHKKLFTKILNKGKYGQSINCPKCRKFIK